MHKEGEQVHIDETEASGGSKEGVVRWVLFVGTFLAIALLSLIWITGALTQEEPEQEATVSGTIEARQDEDADDRTDSIVSERADEIEEAPDPDVPDSELNVMENPTGDDE